MHERINFEPARSHVLSQPGISQQSLQSLGCFCVIASKGSTACIELPSKTTCRVVTRSPGIHLGSSLTFRGGWTSHGRGLLCHTGMFGSFSRAFEVSRSFQCSFASRVRARDDVARRCLLDGRDSRVSVSGLTAPMSVVDRGCLLTPLRPPHRQLLPQTDSSLSRV